MERLEDRTVPYTLSGSKWANLNVSASYVPDGTIVQGGYASTLNQIYDAKFQTATWQREFARALQTWASVTPLNFHFVTDGGQPGGASGQAQGDSRFGDIRFGAKPLGSSLAYTYYPVASSTMGGDANLNASKSYNIGTSIDLFSLVLHETGHSLGLGHSAVTPSVMRASLSAIYTGLYADDIAGIRAVYGARMPDAYDSPGGNDTIAAATTLTVTDGKLNLSADLTTLADVDNYRVTIPSGTDGTATVSVDARNLSLLAPKLSVYNAAGQLVAMTTAGTPYGGVATVRLSGLASGQSYTVVADGATDDVFGMGAYRLAVQFGGYTTSQSYSAQPPATPTITTSTTTSTSGGALLPADDCDECHDHAHEVAYLSPPAGGLPATTSRVQDDSSPWDAGERWGDEFTIPVDASPSRAQRALGLEVARSARMAPRGEAADDVSLRVRLGTALEG